jgi:hypothetical protein
MWDGRLQGVEAIIERKQRMTPECHDHRFLTRTQNRGTGFSWPSVAIFSRHALAPFDYSFDIEPKFPA